VLAAPHGLVERQEAAAQAGVEGRVLLEPALEPGAARLAEPELQHLEVAYHRRAMLSSKA
jgi:hypothetical protein